MNTLSQEELNSIAFRALIRRYLSAERMDRHLPHGAHTFASQTGNRSGLPKGARTMRHRVIASDWEVVVRAVWWQGGLYEPIATHVVVEEYLPGDANPEASRDVLIALATDWLASL